MTTFTSVIQSFPPTLWEQYALEKHTLMLLQVSKGMIEAVCYVGRAPLPAQIDVKPSEVQEALRWNRDKCVELRLDRVKLLVNFVQETDTAEYLMTAHNVINALQYMPNVKTLDFSGLRVICDTEREAVSTNHEVDVYWSNEYASSEAYVKFGKDAYFQVEVIPWFLVRQFLEELTQHYTGVEKMCLKCASLPRWLAWSCVYMMTQSPRTRGWGHSPTSAPSRWSAWKSIPRLRVTFSRRL